MDGLFYFRYLQGQTYLQHRKNRFHMNDGMGEGDGGYEVRKKYLKKGGFVQNNTSYSVCVKSFL